MDKTEKSDPTLLGLPVELQTQIAELLLRDNQSRNAILYLRTTCKELHAVCASNITLLKKRFTKLLERIDERGDCFVENYQGLVDALRTLSHVRKLTYAGGVCGPGLCQVSDADIEDHADEHANWRCRFDVPGMPSTQHGCVAPGWSDTEVVTVLMTGDILSFGEVDFGQPPPICEGTKLPRLLLSGSVPLPLGQTQSLVLTVPGHYGWHEYYHNLFSGAAALEDVKITVSSRIDQWWTDFLNGQRHPTHWSGGAWTLADLPWTLPSETNLISFSMTGTSRIPDAFITKPMVDLLRQCQDTLRSVKFKNVFFSGLSSDSEGIDLKAATRTMLHAIKDLKSQQPELTFEWTIARLKCTTRCPGQGDHDNKCEMYSTACVDDEQDYDWHWYAPDMANLATAFGAPEVDSEWDFSRSDMLLVADEKGLR
ncbi:hypothetical protein LTR17_024188 [Elasticomyces elasticus]|nr:hypothetical protein LTR17_024188 [Elasticomyces elasticus]